MSKFDKYKCFYDLRTGICLVPKTRKFDGITVALNLDHEFRELRGHLNKPDYEKPERNFVINHIDCNDRVLELGSCSGLIGLICAKQCGAANVLSYEANSILEPIISDNYDLNKLHPTLIMKPVTKDGGKVSIKTKENDVLGTQIGRPNGKDDIDSDCFNDVIAEFKPTAIVMDVEGAEIELFEDFVPGTVKKIIVETHAKKIGIDILYPGKNHKKLDPEQLQKVVAKGKEKVDTMIEYLETDHKFAVKSQTNISPTYDKINYFLERN